MFIYLLPKKFHCSAYVIWTNISTSLTKEKRGIIKTQLKTIAQSIVKSTMQNSVEAQAVKVEDESANETNLAKETKQYDYTVEEIQSMKEKKHKWLTSYTNDIYNQCSKDLQKGFEIAVMQLFSKQDYTMNIEEFQMTDQIKTVLSGAVSKVFLNTDCGGCLLVQMQQFLGSTYCRLLASAINMTLIEFCNHTSYGTRLVEVEFLTSDVMKAYTICKIKIVFSRAIHSKWEG